MTRLGLAINEVKTSLKNARQERFDFLGYSFGPHRYKANGLWYLCQTALEWDPLSASKRGSDAILVQLGHSAPISLA